MYTIYTVPLQESLNMQDDDYNNIIDFEMWSQTPLFNLKDQVSNKSIISAAMSQKIVSKFESASSKYDVKQTHNTDSAYQKSKLINTDTLEPQEQKKYVCCINPQRQITTINSVPSTDQQCKSTYHQQNYYYQQFDCASQNKYSFIRSYKYFQQLITGKIDESVFSLNSDTVVDPLRYNRKQTNVAKGLFCSNRECCSLILDVLGRSPYCCKQCQIREQNMRQTRVKSRESMIRRKQALFVYLLRLQEEDFERARIVGIVGVFLQQYGQEFGDL